MKKVLFGLVVCVGAGVCLMMIVSQKPDRTMMRLHGRSVLTCRNRKVVTDGHSVDGMRRCWGKGVFCGRLIFRGKVYYCPVSNINYADSRPGVISEVFSTEEDLERFLHLRYDIPRTEEIWHCPCGCWDDVTRCGHQRNNIIRPMYGFPHYEIHIMPFADSQFVK